MVGLVKDLSPFVLSIFEKHEKIGTLDWLDITIPEDEIWVKIGGDPRFDLKGIIKIMGFCRGVNQMN